jgi:hypothetical protein
VVVVVATGLKLLVLACIDLTLSCFFMGKSRTVLMGESFVLMGSSAGQLVNIDQLNLHICVPRVGTVCMHVPLLD